MEFSLASEDTWRKFLTSPSEVVNDFVKANIVPGSIEAKDPTTLHRLFSQAVLEKQLEDKWTDIPLLNQSKTLDSVKNRSLVRFRCMIQDMFDPEYYLAMHETGNAKGHKQIGFGMYRDRLDESDEETTIDYDSTENVTLNRMTYYCISVPGENEWVREKWNKLAPLVSHQDAEPMAAEESVNHVRSTDAPADVGVKRLRGEESEEKVTAPTSNESPTTAPPMPLHQKLCFPINDQNPNRRACLVKVYDPDEQSFKLNELIDIVGIIQFDSPLESDVAAASAAAEVKNAVGDSRIEYVNELVRGLDLEDSESQFPSSLVPRIHAIAAVPLKHISPLLREPKLPVQTKEFCEKIRSELHAIISQCMFGDNLAADYIICHLLSGVYLRKDVLSLGAFPLNVSNLPKMSPGEVQAYAKSLYALLSRLTTHSVYFPLVLEGLNKGTFVPRKDYSSNKLMSGHLQLPSGILMFVDETAMQPGQLSAEGVKNLGTVGELIKWQKVKYDFKYHELEMDTDVKAFVLSEGKSLLPVANRIPLKVNIANANICVSANS